MALLLGPTITIISVMVIAIWRMSSWKTSIAIRLYFLEEATKEFREDIKKLFTGVNPAPIAGKSPVQLTEYGKKMSRTVNAEQWAAQEASKIVEDAKGREEFEIYDLCIEYVSKSSLRKVLNLQR